MSSLKGDGAEIGKLFVAPKLNGRGWNGVDGRKNGLGVVWVSVIWTKGRNVVTATSGGGADGLNVNGRTVDSGRGVVTGSLVVNLTGGNVLTGGLVGNVKMGLGVVDWKTGNLKVEGGSVGAGENGRGVELGS